MACRGVHTCRDVWVLGYAYVLGHVYLLQTCGSMCDIAFIRAGVNMKALDCRVRRRSDGPSDGGDE